jgi:hypothetical protein
MTDDERKALRWLLGRGARTETVRPADGRRIEQHIDDAGGQAALIRLLRSPLPLNPVIRSALANAFEAPGSSAMRLELNLVRRAGRGRPSGGAKLDLEKHRLNAATEAEEEKGTKPSLAPEIAGQNLAPEIAGKNPRRSRATMYKAKRDVRQAKAIRDGGN